MRRYGRQRESLARVLAWLPWRSAFTPRPAGLLLSMALCAEQSACSNPVQLGKLPNIEIALEPKPPPGDAPPPAPKAALEPPAVHQPPDPAPSRTAEQVDLRLRFEGGRLHLLGSERVTLKESESTPRRLGRFAAELWLGTELLERLRFEVPLLAAEGGEDLEQGLTTEITIRLPLLERANRLEIVDRKTEERLTWGWPPS
jgi:hypothetical protein